MNRAGSSGSGIAADTLKQIFEPFFTTKGLNKGTGLGLSQVHGFAKQSGGEIDVSSRIGVGTIFTLYLPVVQGDPEQLSVTRLAGEERLATRRVLLVEDNEAVGQFARGLFEELGQIVTWVQSGEAALQLLDSASEKFDLVFSDVIMPGINGLELARKIGERWPSLRIVLTSGYSHVLAEESDHPFELLRKPYSVKGIMGVLGEDSSPDGSRSSFPL